MSTQTPSTALSSKDLSKAVNRATRAIPPVWPLASSVAVNPFLGQTSTSLAQTAAQLDKISAAKVTMPREWYASKIDTGEITNEDLADALAASTYVDRPKSVAELVEAAHLAPALSSPIPNIASLATQIAGLDWSSIVVDRIGTWAAGYFDEGQALWAAPKAKGAYQAWRETATHDLTPEIAGLSGFAQFVADSPISSLAAIAQSSERLGLSGAGLDTYFHQLLHELGGWAQISRFRLWQAELKGSTDSTAADLLAIRLLWEEALFTQYEAQIANAWHKARSQYATPISASDDILLDIILQEAYERAAQRVLADIMSAETKPVEKGRPALQAVFCIDVRSEVFRRALEQVDPSIRTLGFAGFFGLSASHKRFASDVAEHRLPVLLNPGVTSVSGNEHTKDADQASRLSARASRAWGRFKLAAVSSFAFVEATGPIYAGKLIRDALGQTEATHPEDPAPRLDPALDLEAQIGTAETILRAMSLTKGFARLVLLTGHGANVANNPHASGLHCGACGGYSGEVNARLLASLLNASDVRLGLVERGIEIPEETLFVGALHDTTTDKVKFFGNDHPNTGVEDELKQARKWLTKAGEIARGERFLRLPRADNPEDIVARARDWAEVRPEWGLAGCKAFIAAPRHRTTSKSLEGRAFLHDYDWKRDDRFGVLELILTAPVIVASWISLQYYGSTVAPNTYGSGNKLLHNVVGGIGVLEGSGGALRAGLPIQSVHDGSDFVHKPLRLSVCIEAPREAMSEILRKHQGVRDLFDNRWLYLFALDELGRMQWRYSGDLTWTPMDQGQFVHDLKEAS